MQPIVPEILAGLSGDVLWAGSLPPRADMVDGSALFDPHQDFRLPPGSHQAFDIAYLVERDLGQIKQWPLVLDEALRALRPGGVLVVRARQSAFLSVFQFANFIERWTGGAYELIDQTLSDLQFVISLRLGHGAPRPASAADFSFAIITDGRRPEAVKTFIRSVLRADHHGGASSEILICGPDSILSDLGPLAKRIVHVPQSDRFASVGWITHKKNALVAKATRENVLIAHDRYSVPDDFLLRMADFGGDFGVVVPHQVTTEGFGLPDWVMLSDDLNWTTPGWMEFGDYHPFAYVNGGVIIAKTRLLAAIRWSELLLWGQAEDVDLSRRLDRAGIVARPCRSLLLTSEPPRKGFIEGFERLPWLEDAYAQTEAPDWGGETPIGPMGLALAEAPRRVAGNAPIEMEAELDLTGAKSPSAFVAQGLILPRDWRPTGPGLRWSGAEAPVFSFRLPVLDDDVSLRISFATAGDLAGLLGIRVNAMDRPFEVVDDRTLQVRLPHLDATESHLFHVWLVRPPVGPLTPLSPVTLTSVRVSRRHDDFAYRPGKEIVFASDGAGKLVMGRGWRPQESWGVWAADRSAELIFHLAEPPRRRLKFVSTIQTVAGPALPEQVVSIHFGDKELGRWTLSPLRSRREVRVALPRRLDSREIRLTFRSKRLISHAAQPGGIDDRLLGVGLVKCALVEGR
ncbi:hypothetical protein [Brevundimonas goettingensis]|uniref:Uncharacterized protein n=1 Tax=Brevundimonas goettingensis TaxID=2774190 RepID=A0A975C4J9_9CAUL|nr:hypothetical protein [Brevundimonas goettingensis]QTC91176.1 hypothetical protein IFJ75_18590 [Brevundimonas goettingensis]